MEPLSAPQSEILLTTNQICTFPSNCIFCCRSLVAHTEPKADHLLMTTGVCPRLSLPVRIHSSAKDWNAHHRILQLELNDLAADGFITVPDCGVHIAKRIISQGHAEEECHNA